MAVRPIDGEALLKELTCDFTGTPFHGNKKVTIGEVRRIIESMPTLTPQNEWISVEDRLPPNMDDVLVVVRDNGECWTATGYYSSMSKVWYAVLNGQDTQMDVLWWMPFPASPDSRQPEGEA